MNGYKVVKIPSLLADPIDRLVEIRQRAYDLAECARMEGARRTMIGGAPYFMSFLEANLIAHNLPHGKSALVIKVCK